MKLVSLSSLAIITAVAVAPVAWAELSGPYAGPSGTVADMQEGGVLAVQLPDGTTFEDAYAIEDGVLTITSSPDNQSCPGQAGSYAYEEGEGGVTFTLEADDCDVRIQELTAGAWVKAETAGEVAE